MSSTATSPADKLKETLDAIGRSLNSQSPMGTSQALKLLEDAKEQVDRLPGATKAQPHNHTGQAADAPPSPGVDTAHFAPGTGSQQPLPKSK